MCVRRVTRIALRHREECLRGLAGERRAEGRRPPRLSPARGTRYPQDTLLSASRSFRVPLRYGAPDRAVPPFLSSPRRRVPPRAERSARAGRRVLRFNSRHLVALLGRPRMARHAEPPHAGTQVPLLQRTSRLSDELPGGVAPGADRRMAPDEEREVHPVERDRGLRADGLVALSAWHRSRLANTDLEPDSTRWASRLPLLCGTDRLEDQLFGGALPEGRA